MDSVVYIPLLCALALAAGAPAIARSAPPRLGSAIPRAVTGDVGIFESPK
jgi:hypothetical protein